MACRPASSDAPMAVPRFVDEEFPLAEATIATLREGLDSGAWTARSILEQYLARIDRLNRSGPALHAVLETNPDAFAIADQLDREWRDRGPRGPLHGIPILLKDNIDTGDRMTTTAGSLALSGGVVTHIPGYVVPVVDTTGAGDIYAAGVLYGLANGMDDAAAGKLGSFASARIVTRIGPRVSERLERHVAAILDGADPTKELRQP